MGTVILYCWCRKYRLVGPLDRRKARAFPAARAQMGSQAACSSVVPAIMRSFLDRLAAQVLAPQGVDFTRPVGEPAMTAPNSVSWTSMPIP
ncbi:hypothetical protein [Sphingomonas xinjiangensis]|uniref:Uncharacterized protein n=1 Tax=Sphingomonas xinjiangensis TaxID=643568 RepID=A0A840Y9U4_9SPHN|nr:hypothetical protein [Sphingomonas xinjiangensis]MBB5710107.1 hypothetical protein [Sphingomonas xinjiangensis]